LTQNFHFRDVPQANTTTQNKHNKLKPSLVASYNIRPGNAQGPILVLALHKFVTYLFTQILIHLLIAPAPTVIFWAAYPSSHPTNCVKALKETALLTPNSGLVILFSKHIPPIFKT